MAGKTAAGNSRGGAGQSAAGLPVAQFLDAGVPGPGASPGGPDPTRVNSLLAALKLPGGELSASILSFAKFFSLSLDGLFLGRIRQRALAGGTQPSASPGKKGSPASGLQFQEAQVQEAQALAALAAAAKGVELSPAALAAYARALLHGQVPPEDGDGPAGMDVSAGEAETSEISGSPAAKTDGPVESLDTEGRDTPGDRGSGTPENFGGKDQDPASGGKGTPRREIPKNPPGILPGKISRRILGKIPGRIPGRIPGIDPAGIRELALGAQGPLLGILNRLPGKDGKRWIVLPFSLEGLDICLRVLLAGSRAELMGLDIRGGEGIWRFILRPRDPPAGAQDSPWSLEICQSPASGEGRTKVLEGELAESLGIPAGELRVRRAPVFAESRDWILPSVNEEV